MSTSAARIFANRAWSLRCLGSGAHGRHGGAVDEGRHGADDAGAPSEGLEHAREQVGRRRLPVGPGDAEELGADVGAVDGGGDEAEHGPGVVDDEAGDRGEGVRVDRLGDEPPADRIGEDRAHACGDEVGGEAGAVDVRPRQGGVESPRGDRARVVGDSRDLTVGVSVDRAGGRGERREMRIISILEQAGSGPSTTGDLVVPHHEAGDIGEHGRGGGTTVVALPRAPQRHGDRELGVLGGDDSDEGRGVAVVAAAFGGRGLRGARLAGDAVAGDLRGLSGALGDDALEHRQRLVGGLSLTTRLGSSAGRGIVRPDGEIVPSTRREGTSTPPLAIVAMTSVVWIAFAAMPLSEHHRVLRPPVPVLIGVEDAAGLGGEADARCRSEAEALHVLVPPRLGERLTGEDRSGVRGFGEDAGERELLVGVG